MTITPLLVGAGISLLRLLRKTPERPRIVPPGPSLPPTPVPELPPTGPIPPQSVETLAPYLALSPKNRYAIRPASEFVATASSLRDQVVELIDHLFVRYPVPLFLYRAMLSGTGLQLVFPGQPHQLTKKRLEQEARLRRWFYAVARGDSFADLAKDFLNRREAHWFLQAPPHHSVATNLRWARVAALGVPPEACDFFLQKFSHVFEGLSDARKMDLARFYARTWSEMRPHERDEIADFILSRLDDSEFRLAGRTAGSVRRMSEAWHRRFEDFPLDRHSPEWLSSLRSWRAAFAPWEARFGPMVVRAVELTNGRQLSQEGSHQGHCVGSYADVCHANRSRIVSLRWFESDAELTRLTVEVGLAAREVFQIRGRFNRRALPEEREVVCRWAEENGLICPV